MQGALHVFRNQPNADLGAVTADKRSQGTQMKVTLGQDGLSSVFVFWSGSQLNILPVPLSSTLQHPPFTPQPVARFYCWIRQLQG